MRIASWQFKPGLWPTAAFVAVFVCLCRLGVWQLDRADEKSALHREYLSRSSAEPIDLEQVATLGEEAAALYWRRVFMQGRYDPGVIYLLDNQVHRTKPGYYVFTRFLLEDGVAVLVNRGWMAAAKTRAQIPQILTPLESMSLTGTITPPPITGILLAEGSAERLRDDLIRVQEINIDAIADENNWVLLPYVVRLDGPAPRGLLRVWRAPGSGRERHLGYAFQWFAMAMALLVIYVILNTKKLPR